MTEETTGHAEESPERLTPEQPVSAQPAAVPPAVAQPTVARTVDVRPIPHARRHPTVFAAFHDLVVGEALLIIADHEPRRLREEFEEELPGSYSWEPGGASAGGGAGASGDADSHEYRATITKRTRTPLPRVVGCTTELDAAPDAAGSIWRLSPADRDLDSNVIALPAGEEIGRHAGPDLDVLILVLEGSGTLETEGSPIPLRPGEIVWLPRRSQRRFSAGPQGIRYLTVHHRKPTLTITEAPGTGGGTHA